MTTTLTCSNYSSFFFSLAHKQAPVTSEQSSPSPLTISIRTHSAPFWSLDRSRVQLTFNEVNSRKGKKEKGNATRESESCSEWMKEEEEEMVLSPKEELKFERG